MISKREFHKTTQKRSNLLQLSIIEWFPVYLISYIWQNATLLYP